MIGVLFPRFDHPAIEERYASWQSQLLLRKEDEVELAFYDPEEPSSLSSGFVDTDHILVVTDPLLVPPPRLAWRLREILVHTPEVIAAVPVTNESKNPHQRRDAPTPYLTLRELQEMAARLQAEGAEGERVKWDDSDPGAYLIQSSVLDSIDDPPRRALAGRDVVISRNDYIHRWIDMRAEVRTDLLPLISTDAKSIIELGCGEAALGAAIKQRQKCRVVGVEIDPHAAAIARKRIDEVYCGDIRHIVEILKEKFDCIVGSEIVEHVDDPWTLLAELHAIATPGGKLILSVPNIAHASIVGDLLQGRLDYTYIGLTCVGHLRFFTRRSIEEMLTISGWKNVTITPQRVPSAGADAVVRGLEAAKIDIAKDDLLATGYYVVAQNRA